MFDKKLFFFAVAKQIRVRVILPEGETHGNKNAACVVVDKKQKWKLGGAKTKNPQKQLNGNNTCTYLVLFLLCVNLVAHAFCSAGVSQMPMVRDILLPRGN